MKKIMILCLFLVAVGLMGNGDCEGSTDSKQRAATEQMTAEAERKLGMPNITNFTERRFSKLILELRDEEITTFTYIVDLNGRLHFLCESIGYGLPYSVQYTNPEKPTWNSYGITTLPQPDPNGLFMPQGLDATFVLCSDGKGGVRPVYSEPKLLVSPFRLKSTDNYQ